MKPGEEFLRKNKQKHYRYKLNININVYLGKEENCNKLECFWETDYC